MLGRRRGRTHSGGEQLYRPRDVTAQPIEKRDIVCRGFTEHPGDDFALILLR